MEKPSDQNDNPFEAPHCQRCDRQMPQPEVALAQEDQLQYCVLCREAVAAIRTAARQAYGGKFRIGL